MVECWSQPCSLSLVWLPAGLFDHPDEANAQRTLFLSFRFSSVLNADIQMVRDHGEESEVEHWCKGRRIQRQNLVQHEQFPSSLQRVAGTNYFGAFIR